MSYKRQNNKYHFAVKMYHKMALYLKYSCSV